MSEHFCDHRQPVCCCDALWAFQSMYVHVIVDMRHEQQLHLPFPGKPSITVIWHNAVCSGTCQCLEHHIVMLKEASGRGRHYLPPGEEHLWGGG